MEKVTLLKIAIAAIAGLALGVVVALGLLSQRGASALPGQTDRPPTADARMDAMEARLERIDNALATITGQSGARAHQARASAAVDTERDDLPSPEAMEAQRREQINAYANAFRNQKSDPQWGLPTEARLLDKMQADHVLSIRASMPNSRTIQCRTDMCQMKFGFSNPGDAVDWADAYVADLGNTVGRTWHVLESRPDGTAEIVMYGFK